MPFPPDQRDPQDQPLVLVVDDDPSIIALMRRLLGRSGYRVMTASTAGTGVALAGEHLPHLVILNPRLGGPSGCDVCRELKSNLSTADIPIIFLTGADPTDEMICRVFEQGAHDFIARPFRPAALLGRIRVVLRDQVLREAYRKLASEDALTGLINRRRFFLDVTQAVMDARRDGSECILILADIDHFKAVNDRFGHDFGDEVIVMMARILKRVGAAACCAARIGGEEFAVVLRRASRQDGLAVAERIRRTFASVVYDADTDPKQFTASIGVAAYAGDPKDFDGDRFLKWADLALYAAKDAGRNRVAAFWEMDPAALPELDSRHAHSRHRKRTISSAAAIRPDEPPAIKPAPPDTAGELRPRNHRAQ